MRKTIFSILFITFLLSGQTQARDMNVREKAFILTELALNKDLNENVRKDLATQFSGAIYKKRISITKFECHIRGRSNLLDCEIIVAHDDMTDGDHTNWSSAYMISATFVLRNNLSLISARSELL